MKEYTEEFYKVTMKAGETQDTNEKVARYVNRLKMVIQDEISILSPKTVEEAYQVALKAEETLMRKQSTRGRGGDVRGRVSFSRGRGGRGRGREIRCYKCNKLGHRAFECPKNEEKSQRNAIVALVEGESSAAVVVEEENIPKGGKSLVVNKVLLKTAKEIVEPSQRNTLFRIVCKFRGKCCQMIIDGGSTDNFVSTEVVDKLKLKTMKHPTPYKVSWLQKGHQVLVNE
eukprot:PITA_13420